MLILPVVLSNEGRATTILHDDLNATSTTCTINNSFTDDLNNNTTSLLYDRDVQKCQQVVDMLCCDDDEVIIMNDNNEDNSIPEIFEQVVSTMTLTRITMNSNDDSRISSRKRMRYSDEQDRWYTMI